MTSTQNTQATKRNFQIGDLVECMSSQFNYIDKKSCHVVLNTREGYYGTQEIELQTLVGLYFWYPSENFELVQSKKQEEPTEFDMRSTPWFIRVKDEEEFEIAKKFVKSKGFFFSYTEDYQACTVITNRSQHGEELLAGKQAVIRTPFVEGKKEIKLHFKTKKVLDYVQYPEVQSEDPDQLEIQKIEDEMRKLADRLKAIKKN